MNRTFVVATALATGLAASSLVAQTTRSSAAHAATTASAPAEVKPQAIPAKIAIIAFEQGVIATNEGQRAVADIQKKYEPKKDAIEALSTEVDSLKKQYQALPANMSDQERASRLKNIDDKEKALQRNVEDAQNSYNQDVQEAYGKIAQKFGGTAVKYAQDHGFTVLLNEGGSQGLPTVLWWQRETDITQAVINAYNTASGVAPLPPQAPTPQHATPTAAPQQQ